ncbi:MAG: group 1 glycosyl transferase [Chloroflexi bacterium CSP1-4]|nr:MAG: group 1 glycosyl transferase [Chloroflexi bacterium CSP1-4]
MSATPGILVGRRVCMFVLNDCTRDSRVLREAASLAAAGAEVTIIARRGEGLPDQEMRGPVRVVRVATRASLGQAAGEGDAVARRSGAGFLARQRPRLERWRALGIRELPAYLGVRTWRLAFVRTWQLVFYVVSHLSYWLGMTFQVLTWTFKAGRHVPAADVYHGHDLTGVGPAWWFARRHRARLVYDSHELYPESGRAAVAPRFTRRVLTAIDRWFMRRADAVVTVNRSIADEMARRYRIEQPVAVMNCPERWRSDDPEPPTFDHFRQTARLPIAPGTPIVIYQGGFRPHRGIEQIVAALLEPELRDAVGVFLGYGPQRDWISAQAARPDLAGRLFVVDAVPPDVLLEWTASADVTISPIQHSTLNHWLSSPNKVFESLAAGVPIVASDFPEMARIIGDTGAGVVCDPADPGAIARATAGILGADPADRAALRRRCRAAALDRYNWETEAGHLLATYAVLVGTPEAGA